MSGMPLTVTKAQVLAHEIPSAVREIATIDGFGGIYDLLKLTAFPRQGKLLTIQLMSVEMLCTRIGLTATFVLTFELLVRV